MLGWGSAGKRPGLVALLAGCAVIVPAATAHGGTAGPTVSLGKAKGFEYMRVTLQNVFSQAGAPAQCAGERFATGGGGAISGPGTEASLNTLQATSPTQGWQAEGSTTGVQGRKLTTYAVCGTKPVTESAGTGSFAPGAEFNSGLTCGGSERASSGGIEDVGGGGDVRIVGLFPAADPFDWIDSFKNAGSENTTVRHSVRCVSGYNFRYRSESARVRKGEAGKVVAKCKESEAVAGGGLLSTSGTSFDFDTWALGSKPWDSKQDAKKVPDDGWLARVHNGADHRIDLTAHAVCRRKG